MQESGERVLKRGGGGRRGKGGRGGRRVGKGC